MLNNNIPETKQPLENKPNVIFNGSTNIVRNILALVTVIGFILITAVLAIIFPLYALHPLIR